MNDKAEPIEVSTRMRPGEWTPQSLEQLTASYQEKLRVMGAPEEEIETSVKTPEDGSAHVHVSWQHAGSHTFSDTGQTIVDEEDTSRGHGETIPAGEPTRDSQGLGAIWGDAERSAIDEPPTGPYAQGKGSNPVKDFRITTDEEGRTHVEDAGPAKE